MAKGYKLCEGTCHKRKQKKEFYISPNLERYPDHGLVPICKDCLTRHINCWDSDTYLSALEMVDVPYVPSEWFPLVEKFARPEDNASGASVFGRYLAKMKLNQYKKYRYKDSEFLQKLAKSEMEEVMRAAGKSEQEIATTTGGMVIAMPAEPTTPPIGVSPAASGGYTGVGAYPPTLGVKKNEPTAKDLGLTKKEVKALSAIWGDSLYSSRMEMA